MDRLARAFRRRPWACASALVAALSATATLGACGDPPRAIAKPWSPHTTSGAGGDSGGDFLDAGTTGPPSPDSSDNCGNVVHGIAIRDAPNVYFVLDASGSMATPDGPGGATRYSAVRGATGSLVRKLGTLVNVGAALFPLGADDVCHVGGQVLALTPGSPPNGNGSDGATTAAFLAATQHAPTGGTPTAATLEALYDGLVGLGGTTIVLLATDGGPNCNAKATCDKEHCIANLEDQCAPASSNCCSAQGPNGPAMCLDDAATVAAIDALQKAGVTVYVIGIATGSAYETVLDAMAKSGGAALSGAHAYYQVDDLGAELVKTLGAIAGKFITCDFKLEKDPVEPTKTNVWLDQTLLPFDPVNGWFWKEKYSELTLAGDACAAVKTGQVHQVQIVEGCPTKVSN